MKLGLILGLTLCLFTAALLAPALKLSGSIAFADDSGEDDEGCDSCGED